MLRKFCLAISCLTSLFASGTWSFGEIAGLRELYGVSDNRMRGVFAINWKSDWNVTAFPNYSPNPTGALRTNLMEYKINGLELRNPHIGGAAGIVGISDYAMKNSHHADNINYDEDIFFTMTLGRDRIQRNENGTLKMQYESTFGQGTVGPEISRQCRALGRLYNYFGLEPYAKLENGEGDLGCTSIYRFNLTNDWKEYVHVEAFVELGHFSNNFVKSDVVKFSKDDSALKDSKTYGFKNYKEPNSKAEMRKYNEVDRISPELYTYFTTDAFSTLDRAQASFYVKTLHKCKQRVLYKIEVKRISIPGSNRDYTIFDSYPSAGKQRCEKAWYDFTCTGEKSDYGNGNDQSDYCASKKYLNKYKVDKEQTWWDLTKSCFDMDGKYCDERKQACNCVRATCTGDTLSWVNDSLVYDNHPSDAYVIPDYRHGRSELFYFYVLQDRKIGGDDCLPSPETMITSSFISESPRDNQNVNYTYGAKEDDKIEDIYTYVDDGKDNKDIYLKIYANKGESKTFKTSKDPFTVKNESYFSIDMGENANYNYYIQKDCTDFKDKDCKYVDATKSSEYNPSLQSTQGLTYKQICKMAQKSYGLKEGSSEALSLCDPDDASRIYEIFFKYNNAILHIPDLKLPTEKNKRVVDEDFNRRNFKIRFYRSYKYVNTQADEIKHRPITIRPASYEANASVCEVFNTSNCGGKESKKLQTTIYDNGNYYVSAFKYRVLDSSSKTPYYFDANADDVAVSFENPIIVDYRFSFVTQNAVIPFVSANSAALAIKDDHIKKYLLDNNYEDANASCIDNDDYLAVSLDKDNITKANTRTKANNYKLYCQTPMSNILNFKYSNVKYDLNQPKDNVDKNAKVNVVIISNIKKDDTSKYNDYRLHPKIKISANNNNVVKYFNKDLKAKLTLNFNKNIDYSKLKVVSNSNNDFSEDMGAGVKTEFSIAKYIVNASEIETKAGDDSNSVVVLFKLSANDLNKPYDNMLNDIAKDKTTYYLINHNELKPYARIEKYANVISLEDFIPYAAANENSYEIPLAINYKETQAKPFILENAKLELFNEDGSEVKFDNVALESSKNITLNTMFAQATPVFKDQKSLGNTIFVQTGDVKLRWLDGVYKDFLYIINNDKDFNFVSYAKCIGAKNMVATPCFRVVNGEYPGLSYDTEFISDYGMKITKCKSLAGSNCVKASKGDNLEGIKLELVNSNTKDAAYVKDTVHCYGGEYNCNTNFTIERIKN